MVKRKARPGAVSPGENGGTKKKVRRKGRTRSRARRNHKDGLFCRLFLDRENALSLYNALTEAVDAAVDTCIRRGRKAFGKKKRAKRETSAHRIKAALLTL